MADYFHTDAKTLHRVSKMWSMGSVARHKRDFYLINILPSVIDLFLNVDVGRILFSLYLYTTQSLLIGIHIKGEKQTNKQMVFLWFFIQVVFDLWSLPITVVSYDIKCVTHVAELILQKIFEAVKWILTGHLVNAAAIKRTHWLPWGVFCRKPEIPVFSKKIVNHNHVTTGGGSHRNLEPDHKYLLGRVCFNFEQLLWD